MDEMQRLRRARTLLLLHYPFFGYLTAKLKLVETEAVPTAATDGKSIFFNPKFTKMLDPNQTLTLIAHEVGHPALLFWERCGMRNKKKFNMAQDHAWNLVLKDSGFAPLSVAGKFDWLCDDQFKGQVAERIYDQLPEPPPEYVMDVQGDGGAGASNDPPQADGGAGDPSSPQPPPVNWKRAMVEAAQYAKMRGKLPGGIEEMIDEIIHPKINFRSIIRSTMSLARKTDWSFRRPNKRYAHQGICVPVPYGYTTRGEVWLDTSGSMGTDELKVGLGLCVEVSQQLRVAIDVGICDASVHDFQTNVKGTDIVRRVRIKGRGGTNFTPAFEHVRDHRRRPDFLIYFTDLCGSFPDWKPKYQVLWAVPERYKNDEAKVPFGRILWVPEEQLKKESA